MFSRVYSPLVLLLLALMWLGTLGEFEVGKKAFLTGILLGGIAPMMWLDMFLKGGVRSLYAVPMMIRFFGRSRRSSTLMGIMVFCLLFWLSPFAANPSPYRIHMSVTLVLTVALLWLQPPFALILGASSPSTGKVLGTVSSELFPLRVVGLLRGTGYFAGAFSVLTDNLRTESDRDWREVVEQLSDSVALIVLDTRTESPIVAEEVQRIVFNPNRLGRTLFVVGPEGEAPALQANGLSIHSPGVKTVREEEIKERSRTSR